MDKTQEPLVSICCITYNHEKYIRDAIESFLMQETDFPFEIIIHDDASTDRTAEIIREYEKKYPDLIKPIYQTENQYSKGVKPLLLTYKVSKGKYIAFCEGDDYWTDPLKLQKQFECLEKNPSVVCCYHNDQILDDSNLKAESSINRSNQKNFSSYELMSCKNHISTRTVFFRNIDALRNYPPENFYVKNGDTFLFSILGQYGSGMYLPTIKPAVYRFHEGGVWSKKSESEKLSMSMNTYYWIAEYYARLGNYEIEEELRFLFLNRVRLSLAKPHLILPFLRHLPSRIIETIKYRLSLFIRLMF